MPVAQPFRATAHKKASFFCFEDGEIHSLSHGLLTMAQRVAIETRQRADAGEPGRVGEQTVAADPLIDVEVTVIV